MSEERPGGQCGLGKRRAASRGECSVQTFGHKGFMAPSRGTGGRPAVSTAVEGSDATSPRDRVAATPGTGGRGQGQRPGGRGVATATPVAGGDREAAAKPSGCCRVLMQPGGPGGGSDVSVPWGEGRRGGRTGRSTLCSRRLGPARPSRAPCRLQEGPASHSGLSLGRVSRSCEMAPAVPQFAVRRVRSVSVRLLSYAFDAFQRRSQMLTHLSSDCGVSVVS